MSNQFNYNLNSINFFIQENSGSITGVSTEFEDYGDVQGLPVQLDKSGYQNVKKVFMILVSMMSSSSTPSTLNLLDLILT